MATYKYRGVEVREDLKILAEETPLNEITLQASKILPELPVMENGGSFKKLPAGTGYKLSDTRRAGDGGYDRGTHELVDDSFTTDTYGAEEGIDVISQQIMSNVYDMEETNSVIARNRMLLAREKRVSDAVFNTSVFTGAAFTDSVTTPWTNSAADFRLDIRESAEILRKRTKLQRNAFSLLLTSDRIEDMVETLAAKESIKYTRTLDLDSDAGRLQALTNYIGVKEIVALEAMGDVAGLGLDVDFDFLYPNNMAMLALLSPTTPTWKTLGLGRQPVFTKVAKDYVIETYDEMSKDKRWVRAKEHRGEKIFSHFGFLLTGIA